MVSQVNNQEEQLAEVKTKYFHTGVLYRGVPFRIIPVAETTSDRWVSPWDALSTPAIFSDKTIQEEIASLQKMFSVKSRSQIMM